MRLRHKLSSVACCADPRDNAVLCNGCAVFCALPCTQVVYVVATKVDLPGRRVSQTEGQNWAAARGYPYVEVRGQ